MSESDQKEAILAQNEILSSLNEGLSSTVHDTIIAEMVGVVHTLEMTVEEELQKRDSRVSQETLRSFSNELQDIAARLHELSDSQKELTIHVAMAIEGWVKKRLDKVSEEQLQAIKEIFPEALKNMAQDQISAKIASLMQVMRNIGLNLGNMFGAVSSQVSETRGKLDDITRQIKEFDHGIIPAFNSALSDQRSRDENDLARYLHPRQGVTKTRVLAAIYENSEESAKLAREIRKEKNERQLREERENTFFKKALRFSRDAVYFLFGFFGIALTVFFLSFFFVPWSSGILPVNWQAYLVREYKLALEYLSREHAVRTSKLKLPRKTVPSPTSRPVQASKPKELIMKQPTSEKPPIVYGPQSFQKLLQYQKKQRQKERAEAKKKAKKKRKKKPSAKGTLTKKEGKSKKPKQKDPYGDW